MSMKHSFSCLFAQETDLEVVVLPHGMATSRRMSMDLLVPSAMGAESMQVELPGLTLQLDSLVSMESGEAKQASAQKGSTLLLVPWVWMP